MGIDQWLVFFDSAQGSWWSNFLPPLTTTESWVQDANERLKGTNEIDEEAIRRATRMSKAMSDEIHEALGSVVFAVSVVPVVLVTQSGVCAPYGKTEKYIEFRLFRKQVDV